MVLPFSTHINDLPNFFVEKIHKALKKDNTLGFTVEHVPKSFNFYVFNRCKPKIHTIREDLKDIWKAGKKIHPVIHNRTRGRFQFAPEFVCKATQRIFMTYTYGEIIQISIAGRELTTEQREEFAINDGFENWKDFFEYFYPIIMKSSEQEFTGKVIHFTDFKY